MQTTTLYEALGGAGAVSAVVDIFYDRVVSDPMLAPFFAGVDLQRLRRHQAMFVTMATGGPPPAIPFDLRMAHQRLAIGDEHFDRVVQHLVAALRIAAVDQPRIDAVIDAVAPLRPEVVRTAT